MSLQVWLPLNGDLKNQGLADITVTTSTSPVFKDYGKIGGKCLDLSTRIAFNCPALSGVTTFSVAFWVKLEDDSSITTNWQDIISFTDQKADNSGTGVLRAETCYGNTNYNGVHWHDNSGYCMSKSSETLPTHYSGDRGIWHHCVMTIDSNKEVKSYTDGVLLGTYVASGGGHLTGAFHLGENNLIVGGIADVRIWDEVISMKEVKQLSQGLVLHYKLSGIGRPNNIKKSTIIQRSSTITFDSSTREYTMVCPSNTSVWGVGLYINDTSIKWKSGQTWLISMDVYTPQQIGWNADINNKPDVEDQSSYTGNDYDITSERKTSTNGVLNAAKTLKVGWNKIWFSQKAPTTYGLQNYSTNFGIVTTDIASGSSITVKIKNIKGEVIDDGEVLGSTPWIPNSADAEYASLGFNDGIEYDCSGFGNDGIKTGNFECDSNTARYTTSYIFEDSSAQHINRPYLSELKQNITMSCWAYQTSASNTEGTNQYIMSQGRDVNGNGFSIRSNNGTPYLYMNTGTSLSLSSGVSILNGWHHLTATYDGSKACIYVDGELKGSKNLTGDIDYSMASDRFVIGKMSYSYTSTAHYFPFVGNIVDARVYATALSSDDILTLYNTAATIDNQGNLFTYEVVEG